MSFDFPRACDINRLHSEMQRLFGRRTGGEYARVPNYPAINVWEDDDNLCIESEVPGMELKLSRQLRQTSLMPSPDRGSRIRVFRNR